MGANAGKNSLWALPDTFAALCSVVVNEVLLSIDAI